MFQRHFTQRGSALIFAIGFMVVLLIITAVSVSFMQSQLRSSATARQRVAAEYRAQAGLNQAIAWFGAWPYVLPQASTPLTWSVPVSWTANPVQLPGNHPDTYVDATGNSQSGVVWGTTGATQGYRQYFTSPSTNGYNVVASLISQNPEVWELISTGQFGPTQRQAGAIIFRRPIPGLFDKGFFGQDSINFTQHTTTNSYDSSTGSACNLNNGNIATNGTINLGNSATINGNALAGPSATPVMNNSAQVTGTSGSETYPKALPTIAVPTIPAGGPSPISLSLVNGSPPDTIIISDALCISDANCHYSSISLTGNNNSLTIIGSTDPTNPQTLLVDGDLTLKNGSSLTLSGSLQIVVGSFSLYNSSQVFVTSTDFVDLYVTTSYYQDNSANIVNSGRPQNFQLWYTGTTELDLGNSTNFYGTVYAPNATMGIKNNSTFDGAFVAKSINVTNSPTVCYDQSLGTIGWNPGTFRLIMQWLVPSS
jgi:Tfp pilus assembly protein PilX